MGLRPVDFVCGVSVALVWGMGFVFSKAAIAHFPPILLMSLRFMVTALVLIWLVRPPRRHMGRLFVISLVSAAVQYSLTFTGLKSLDASVATLVLQLEAPFLVLLGALLLAERPGWRKWAGIALAFVGVGLIAGELRFDNAWGAMAMVVGGAFTWALGQVMIRALKDIDGVTITAWIALFAAPQLLVMSLVFETGQAEAIITADRTVWATVLYLGVVMTALGYGLWYSLLRRHPVGMVAPFLLLLPVFAVIGGVVLLGESLTPSTVLGGVVVIFGVGVIVLEDIPKSQRSATVKPRRPA